MRKTLNDIVEDAADFVKEKNHDANRDSSEKNNAVKQSFGSVLGPNKCRGVVNSCRSEPNACRSIDVGCKQFNSCATESLEREDENEAHFSPGL